MIDVLVVGGGPVGLVAALHARCAGLGVRVLEPRAEPIDKACGEGLMPTALSELHRLGITVTGRPFDGIRYVDEIKGVAVAASFEPKLGLGVRRTVLHETLHLACREAGVLFTQERAADLGWRTDRAAVRTASGERFTGRWLLAADGLHSWVRRRLGLQRALRGPARFGLRRHVRLRPWASTVDVHWADGAEAYVTPVADDLVGICVLTSERAPFGELLDRFPQLRQRLSCAPFATGVRGAGPLLQRTRARRRGPVLMVGDAGGYVDALTGEGLASGFASARLAVACLVNGSLDDYETLWRRATLSSRAMTRGVLAAASSPSIRRQLVPAAQRFPSVYQAAVRALG